jgi:hypothetical protein
MGAGIRDVWPLRGRRSRTTVCRWLAGWPKAGWRNWVAGLAGAGEWPAAVWCGLPLAAHACRSSPLARKGSAEVGHGSGTQVRMPVHPRPVSQRTLLRRRLRLCGGNAAR